MDDFEKFADGIFDSVKTYIDARLAKFVPTLPPEQVAAIAEQQRAMLDEYRDAIAGEVQRQVEAIEIIVPEPVPGRDGKDGQSIDPEEVRMFLRSELAQALLAMPKPRDGVDGKSVSFEEVRATVELAIRDGLAKLPQPKDGKDGFGFDDLAVESLDGGRVLRVKFARGEEVKTFDLVTASIIDRGVYRDDLAALAGDAVTWGGSLWIAQRASRGERPGTSDAWRLAVKHGRDGKDAEPTDKKNNGPVRLK